MKSWKQYLLFLIIVQVVLVCVPTKVGAQDDHFQNSFLETTTPTEKFSIYLDSIDKYVYRDVNIATFAYDEAQKLLDEGLVAHDTLLFLHKYYNILLLHNRQMPMEAYRTILANEELFNSSCVSIEDKKSIKYLTAFTFMEIGDYESAQKSYYENIKYAEEAKDTSSLVSNLYSLGQLLSQAEKYAESEVCFQRIFDLKNNFTIRPSTLGLCYFETAENYLGWEKYDQGLELVEEGIQYTEANQLEVLKIDLLIIKGQLLLGKGDIAEAMKLKPEISRLNSEMNDVFNIMNFKYLQAKLCKAQGKFKESENIYQDILVSLDTIDLEQRFSVYEALHKLSNEQGDKDRAYAYLLKANDLNDQLSLDKRKQKTEYLELQFEVQKKVKDNELLKSQLERNSAERKFLYAIIALGLVSLILILGVLRQKQSYNDRLEKEVLRRTNTINESNALLQKSIDELYAFSRILSHDLKEPLRNIVSFSQLGSKEIDRNPEKAKSYLSYVKDSGEQLDDLIEGVKNYTSYEIDQKSIVKTMDLNHLIEDILPIKQKKYPNKQINITYSELPTIVSSYELIKTVFRNLIDNSIKFNKHDDVLIELRHSESDGFHIIDIKDNGIGIEGNYQDQIFDMFKRLHTRDTFKGSGLGLSLVRKIMSMMGGDIQLLKSDVNNGSTFRLSIPI